MKLCLSFLLLFGLICIATAYYTAGVKGTEDVVAVKLSPTVQDHINSTLIKEKIAHIHGYIYLGPVGELSHYHMYAKAPHHTPEHPHLSTHPLVLSVHPQYPLERAKRSYSTPTDPLYSRQWHLHQLRTPSSTPHINVVPSWETYGFGSPNITVGIVDDGLQSNHPDLSNNYIGNFSWDWMDNRNDPSPIAIDTHGTSASGCVGAQANRVCGVGVAPGVRIAGLRIMKGDYGVSDAGEAAALGFKCNQGNDIYTCSWGPFDDGRRLEGPGHLADAAIQQCIKQGRGGKGTIYVWAGGNGASNNDNVNYDGYANRRETIAVGAITDKGARGYYSEVGSPLLVVTPSSGGSSSIATTSGGGGCSSTFGGTSASSPIAAGSIALILSANPELGWRDVQHILVRTATKSGIANTGSFVKNPAGFEHSMEYGFGVIDTFAAVKMAKDWKNVAGEGVVHLLRDRDFNMDEPLPIGTNKIKTVSFSVGAQKGFKVEHVQVHVKLTGSTRGRVDIYVKSPGGMESTLQENHGKDSNTNMDWNFWSVRHWGEEADGEWTVRFVNNGYREGRLQGLEIFLHGYYT